LAQQNRGAPGDTSESPTETIGRYLEAIFYIDAEGETVRASRLADWLGVSQATVAAGVRRMVKQGLISLSPQKEITLTATGRDHAAQIVRRHRIAERWLTDVLGFDWLKADEEASRLEHGISTDVADRLHELIGRPRTCPHGNPIPGADPVPGKERALATLAPGERSRIRRISEVAEHETPELLSFLARHGIRIGKDVETVEVSRGAGTVTVRVDGTETPMSLEVAGKIWIDD
jgi:DtxR family transcriptional regulator, Mn-dependent transcriptional regulator